MYTVLVTGTGAIIGYGLIKCLRASRFPVRVIGVDMYPDAVGRHWCEHFETIPQADAPHYAQHMAELTRRLAVDLVIPGIEQDVHRLATEFSSGALPNSGCHWALNRPELIEIAADKWATHQALERAGIPTIPTFTTGNFEDLASRSGPLLVKPRRSYAGRGIHRLDTAADFEYWKHKRADDFLVQQIVGSDDLEFTVAAFGLGDGAPVQQIALRRRLAADGSTSKAVVENLPELAQRVDTLVALFRPVGPTNFQFRFHRGEYLLLEINARVSSSTSLRAAFGYNEAEMCMEYFLEGQPPAQRAIQAGQAGRFVEDRVTLT